MLTQRPARLVELVRHSAPGIAARAAAMEARVHAVLPHHAPWAVRLDGVGFRTYTAHMHKPFDARLTRAMVLTARDVMARFAAVRAAYVQSDEITLVFPPADAPAAMVYSGRLQKIVSVTASLASASFNSHVASAFHETLPNDHSAPTGNIEGPQKVHQLAFFDARAFSTEDAQGAAENILWRHALDGNRNAVSMAAAAHMPSSQMHGMSLKAMLEVLSREHSVHPFRDYSPAAMRGVVLKRAVVQRPGFNPKTGEASVATRMRIEGRSLDLTALSGIDVLANLLLSPTWTECDPPSLCPVDV